MRPVTIRPATTDDLPAYDRLLGIPDVVRDTLHLPFATRDERESGVTSTASTRVLAALVSDEIAGFGTLQIFERRRAHAGQITLVVDPDFVQADVAMALVRALIDLGERWYGLRRFEVKAFTDDQTALPIYEQAGFEIEATHKRFALRDGVYADAFSMARLHD